MARDAPGGGYQRPYLVNLIAELEIKISFFEGPIHREPALLPCALADWHNLDRKDDVATRKVTPRSKLTIQFYIFGSCYLHSFGAHITVSLSKPDRHCCYSTCG